MAIKLPSIGIDQNKDEKFIDKYWGRVPKYLHRIKELQYTDNPITVCNPEYMELVELFMTGELVEGNVSKELYIDIQNTIDGIPNYGRIPNIELDPLYECMGYEPSAESCAMLADKDCVLILDSDGCYISPPAEDIWDYQYFTDSDSGSYGIYVLDWRNMELIDHIATHSPNPHSVDRAVLTDRMLIRTQNVHAFDVMDARSREIIKTVPLPHKPRTSGGQNYQLNLQLIAGKDHPMISVVDVFYNETVLGSYGPFTQPGQVPTGNGGGSATGHPVWLDDHHFANIDRLNDVIRIYAVKETGSKPIRFTIEEIQEFHAPGVHIMSTEDKSYSYETKLFWMATEGSVILNNPPSIFLLKWDTRVLRYVVDDYGEKIWNECPTTSDDVGHHYEVNIETNEIWYPTFKSGQVFIFDATTLEYKHSFAVGAGAGHVNFSYAHKVACITNHFDNMITAIEWDTEIVHQIVVNDYPLPTSKLIQTHQNKTLPSEHSADEDAGRYYFMGMTAPTTGGEFKRLDLKELRDGNIVVDTIVVGGHPEQSTS